MSAPHDAPDPATLLDAVHEFLVSEVEPELSGRLRYHLKVAANVVRIVERELAQPVVRRAGDDWETLALAVRDRLAVANPKHLR